MENKIVHKRTTPIKKRDNNVYAKKVSKITKWYNHLQKEREQDVRIKNKQMINPNTKQEPKRKELKPLDEYISKIKKVVV